MQDKAVITCFSYNNNRKYMFNSDYLRSDLRRILSFVLNKIGCPLNDITILTDISPYGNIVDEIRAAFQDEVEKYLHDIGYHKPIIRTGKGGIHLLEWLHKICREASKYVGKSEHHLFRGITREVLPIMRSSNVIEFVSLFTNFIIVKGKYHYETSIRNIFESMGKYNNLFFYYTGHGVRFISFDGNVRDICLVIPFHNSTVEFYSKDKLQLLFNKIPANISSFIVFDCCHSEKILELPYKIISNKMIKRNISHNSFQSSMIYLSSTQNDQTCGFYINKEECGSIFTYYLMNCLESITVERPGTFLFLYNYIEEKVQQYRKSTGKPPQNMSISTNRSSISSIPDWIFINKHKSGFRLKSIERRD